GGRLEGADIRRYGPPIRDLDLSGVIGHPAEAVRDHIEEMARRRLPQMRSVERRRRRVPPLDDDAVTGPGPAMARRTVDIEALPSTRHDCLRDWKREGGDILVVHLACIKQL